MFFELGLSLFKILLIGNHFLLQIVDDLKNLVQIRLLQLARLSCLKKVLKLRQSIELNIRGLLMLSVRLRCSMFGVRQLIIFVDGRCSVVDVRIVVSVKSSWMFEVTPSTLAFRCSIFGNFQC